jgi:hypothetical protein
MSLVAGKMKLGKSDSPAAGRAKEKPAGGAGGIGPARDGATKTAPINSKKQID